MTEVTAEKRRAEMALRSATPTQAPTPAELRTLIEGLGDMVAVLESADPTKRAALYDALGLRLTFQPDEKRVLVEAQPARVLAGGVGGGSSTVTPRQLGTCHYAV